MKTAQLIAVAALSLVAAVGAQAQGRSSEEVNAEAIAAAHAPNQNVVRGSRGPETVAVSKDRSIVEAEAVAAAHAPNQNVVRGSRGPETVAVSKDRSMVEADAVVAAHAPDQNVVAGSRVNSKVISTMANPALVRVQAQQGAGALAK